LTETIFNSQKKLGEGHMAPGRIRVPESLRVMNISDAAISLFSRLLNYADDQMYGNSFGLVTGSDNDWLNLMGMRPGELKDATDELKAIGLIQSKGDELFIVNYRVWCQGTLAERSAYVEEISG